MQITVDTKGRRVFAYNAKKENVYFCPSCGGCVTLRQGSINVAHFAHRSNECVDHWNYDMSEWHYSMQNRFPEEQREVVVKHMGQIHRADVLHKNYVIEFQHSPISTEEIEERNKFYTAAGYNVAWVFDVQEQYDSDAISYVESSNALQFKWSNPKRCLQCFPLPKENAKNLMIYLYWLDEEGVEFFGRVIWSTGEDYPDFRRFIVSKDMMSREDTEEGLSVEVFFETRDDLIKKRLAELNCRCKVKYAGVKGYPRVDYICPRTNVFGLKLFGEAACRYCKYCGLVNRYSKGFASYCCYPIQVNEVDEAHPGFECSNVTTFE